MERLLAPNGLRLKVFVSYSRKDSEAFADELVAGLEFHGGFDVTIDRSSIVEGEDWKKRLTALIADADTVVFIVSPCSTESPICHWEVDEASRLSKRILPVLWLSTGDAPVHDHLAALNYTRFDGGRSFIAGLKALVGALTTDIEWLREHTRLLARALEWDKAGRLENRMLTGPDVAEAKHWAGSRPANAPELTTLHLEFIRVSEEGEINRQNSERQQLERLREAQAESKRAASEKLRVLYDTVNIESAPTETNISRHRVITGIRALAAYLLGVFSVKFGYVGALIPIYGIWIYIFALLASFWLFYKAEAITYALIEKIPIISAIFRRLVSGRDFIEGSWPAVATDNKGNLLFFGCMTIIYVDGHFFISGVHWWPTGMVAHNFQSSASRYEAKGFLRYGWKAAAEEYGITEMHFFPNNGPARRCAGQYFSANPGARFYAQRSETQLFRLNRKRPEDYLEEARELWVRVEPNIIRLSSQPLNEDWAQ